jgi:anti-sigma-K factor RskA
MNTPIDDAPSNLRYAEYVLGVLDADARAAVEREVVASDAVAVTVALWQRRLMPLVGEITPIEPPPYVWERIRDQLGLRAVPTRTPPATKRPGLWENLRFWHGLALGASAVALACLVLLMLPSRSVAPLPPAAYMASAINQDNGQVGWTATMDLTQGHMVVVPAKPQAIATGRAPELWLIPPGGKPIAVGMIASDAPTTLTLDRSVLARLGTAAALAVSLEPPGGSPTGQPTGPVIAQGAIGASPPARGKPVALLHTSLVVHDHA